MEVLSRPALVHAVLRSSPRPLGRDFISLHEGGGHGSGLPDRRGRMPVQRKSDMDTKAIYGTAKIAAATTLLSPLVSPHSHSIVRTYINLLILRDKLFLIGRVYRHLNRQKVTLLILKGKSPEKIFRRFRRLSRSIGRFAAVEPRAQTFAAVGKIPSDHNADRF